MKDPEKLKDELRYFSGSETWHNWSALYPCFLLTDGAKFLADEAEAYWLMDIIGSYQGKLLPKEPFQVWRLIVGGSDYQKYLDYQKSRQDPRYHLTVQAVLDSKKAGLSVPPMAIVVCEDGNDKELIRQEIKFTDFPLEEIKLYFIWDGDHGTILLPSEY